MRESVVRLRLKKAGDIGIELRGGECIFCQKCRDIGGLNFPPNHSRLPSAVCACVRGRVRSQLAFP